MFHPRLLVFFFAAVAVAAKTTIESRSLNEDCPNKDLAEIFYNTEIVVNTYETTLEECSEQELGDMGLLLTDGYNEITLADPRLQDVEEVKMEVCDRFPSTNFRRQLYFARSYIQKYSQGFKFTYNWVGSGSCRWCQRTSHADHWRKLLRATRQSTKAIPIGIEEPEVEHRELQEVGTVDKLVLYDTSTNPPVFIKELRNGDIINQAEYGTKLTVEAITSGNVNSVNFHYMGNGEDRWRLENAVPWVFSSNYGAQYFPSSYLSVVGQHNFEATPYSRRNKSGTRGQTFYMKFLIVENQVDHPETLSNSDPQCEMEHHGECEWTSDCKEMYGDQSYDCGLWAGGYCKCRDNEACGCLEAPAPPAPAPEPDVQIARDDSCKPGNFYGECTLTTECKNTYGDQAYDCLQWGPQGEEWQYCLCGDGKPCGCQNMKAEANGGVTSNAYATSDSPSSISSSSASFSGTVYVDSDDNSQQNGGEPGIADVEVSLFEDGNWFAATKTDHDGKFSFSGSSIGKSLTNGRQYIIRIYSQQHPLYGFRGYGIGGWDDDLKSWEQSATGGGDQTGFDFGYTQAFDEATEPEPVIETPETTADLITLMEEDLAYFLSGVVNDEYHNKAGHCLEGQLVYVQVEMNPVEASAMTCHE